MATHSTFLPGESHRQRSLESYSPWDHKELDTTLRLTLSCFFHFLLTVQWLPTNIGFIPYSCSLVSPFFGCTSWHEKLPHLESNPIVEGCLPIVEGWS